MQIKRRFTTAGKSPYEKIPFRRATSEIKNPDGSVVFRLENFAVPEHWSQVAADILAQKYFRKAGVPARLKRIEETQVPSWLWRSAADERAPRRAARERALRRRDRRPPGLRPPGRHLDLLGLEGRLLHQRGRRARLLRRAPLHAGHADRRAQQPAVVQHRPALGLRHRRARPGPLLRRPRDRRADGLARRPTSIPSRTPASSSRSRTISSTRTASWTCGCARRASSSTAPAPAPTSPSCARENEKLSGGGKSSGLMSFLKIGDRAAGAIKSGGTTRRAAKMVVVDIDHPDIEDYIDWKVKEEQKVAALVTGSKICQRRLKAIMKACVNCEAEGDACFDPPRTRRSSAPSRRRGATCVPDNYIRRVIQFARQGYKDIEFATYDTDWDSEAYLTVSGQNSNNSVRVTDEFLNAVERGQATGTLTARLGGTHGQDAEGARPVGEDRPRRLGLRRSRHPVPHHHQRLAHLPEVGADPRVQPVLGVHVPRRHGLQPRLAQPDALPRRATSASTSTPSSTPAGCGPSCSRSRC